MEIHPHDCDGVSGKRRVGMSMRELFDEMDLDGDGAISRCDLHNAALRLGWQWQDASLYAVLDLLTLPGPVCRDRFVSLTTRMTQDPLGPYGEALAEASRRLPEISLQMPEDTDCDLHDNLQEEGGSPEDDPCAPLVAHLEGVAGVEAGSDYRALMEYLGVLPTRIKATESALLIIDPQRSFTCGAWAQSLGVHAESESAPIRLAFDNCARLMRGSALGVETMLTRCPFPPESYDWDERFAGALDNLPYFVKPGNSVLWPPTNGFAQWVEGLMDRGKKTLVMGGCTLNSCVRVSAMDTLTHFAERGLRVVVVLSLSAARTGNYLRSPQFGGMSSVEHAVRTMISAGIAVFPSAIWE